MTNLKFLQRFFLLLFMGISMCALQACSDDDDESSDFSSIEGTWIDIEDDAYVWVFTADGKFAEFYQDEVPEWESYSVQGSTLCIKYQEDGETITDKFEILELTNETLKVKEPIQEEDGEVYGGEIWTFRRVTGK